MPPKRAPSQAEDTIPDVLGGRYKVIREIGRGGMGTVFLVAHLHTGERLALKLLKGPIARESSVRERFRREMQTPARIRSEYVVRITDADLAAERDGAPFLVMELLEGCDFTTLLHDGPLSPMETVWCLRQVARALERAHSAGIVHRDLKPPNLFLHRREDGSLIVKVLDFGIAKLIDIAPLDDTAQDLTQQGAIVGTPGYMAPEQALGMSNRVGPASDLWAMGIIAFRMLTGQPYWRGNQLVVVLAQIASGAMVPPSQQAPGLDPAFDAWFLRSCARDPAARWPDARAQLDALADAFQVSPLEPAPSSLQRRLPGGGAIETTTLLYQRPDSVARQPEPQPPASLVSLATPQPLPTAQTKVKKRRSLLPFTVALAVLAVFMTGAWVLHQQGSQPALAPSASPDLSGPSLPELGAAVTPDMIQPADLTIHPTDPTKLTKPPKKNRGRTSIHKPDLQSQEESVDGPVSP